MRTFLLLLAIWAVQAEQRELGILAGGGLSSHAGIQGSPGAGAGFAPGPAVGVLVGQDLYSRWSGEIRYLFELRDAHLRSGGTTAGFSGQAHALHYDLVFHSRSRGHPLRPYVAAGGGVKIYRGTGAEAAYRPLMQYGYLTRTYDLKPMLTVGGGVKFRLGKRLLGRIDFRDQITPFPVKVITPAPGMAIQAWLHDFVPAFGLTWLF